MLTSGQKAAIVIAVIVVSVVAGYAIWYYYIRTPTAAVTYGIYAAGAPSLSVSLGSAWNYSAVNQSTATSAWTGTNILTVSNDGTAPATNVRVAAFVSRAPTGGDDDLTVTLTPGSGVIATRISASEYTIAQLGYSTLYGTAAAYTAQFTVGLSLVPRCTAGTYFVTLMAQADYTTYGTTVYGTLGTITAVTRAATLINVTAT